MSNYSKVQFISWEVHTGPFRPDRIPGYGAYAGLYDASPDKRTDVAGQCRDIEARIAFTAEAIASALRHSDTDAGTLKLFMAPEFLYRGAGGAYLHDLLNGWDRAAPGDFLLPARYAGRWPGLFGHLQALVAGKEFDDWVFVFGTAVSAEFPTKEEIPNQCVLDAGKPGKVYNTALIQRGGPDHRAVNYASRKHYRSRIDFLRWYAGTLAHTKATAKPADHKDLIPVDALGEAEGAAVFRLRDVNDGAGAPLDFGIEICLDHAESGGDSANGFGRIRTAGQYVKLQLVPSGGMSLVPESIRLQPAGGPTPHAYAFNCDGLAGFDDEYGSHTQVWNGANGAVVPLVNRLLEVSGGEQAPNTVLEAVAATVSTPQGQVAAHQLWNNGDGVQGAGHVRVVDPLPL